MKKFLLLGLTMLIATSCTLNLVTDFTYADADSYSVLNESEEINTSVNELDITWVAGNIDIQFHDKPYLSISEEKKSALGDYNYNLRYKVDGSKLYVQYCKSGSSLRNPPTKNVSILLPRTTAIKRLNVNNVSGEVTAYLPGCDIANLTVEITTGNANLSADSITKTNLEIITGSANLEANYLKIVDANVTTGSGTIKSKVTAPDSLKLDIVTGNGNISIPDNSGFTVNSSIVLGKFINNFTSDRVYGDGSRSYNLSCVTGNLTLNKI